MSIIAGLGVWLNPYTITKKSILENYEVDKFNDSTSIAKLGVELADKDKIIYSLQQDIDICNGNKASRESVIDKLTKQRDEALAEAKKHRKEIEQLEANGMIEYYVFDSRGIFRTGCFQKALKKPDNICK